MKSKKTLPSSRSRKSKTRLALLYEFEPFLEMKERLEMEFITGTLTEDEFVQAMYRAWKIESTIFDTANCITDERGGNDTEVPSFTEALKKEKKPPEYEFYYMDLKHEQAYIEKGLGISNLCSDPNSEWLVLPLSLSKGEAKELVANANFKGNKGYTRGEKVELDEHIEVMKLMQSNASPTEVARTANPQASEDQIQSSKSNFYDKYAFIVNEIIDPPTEFRVKR